MNKKQWYIIAAAVLVCVCIVLPLTADRVHWTVCRDNSDCGSAALLQSALNADKLENREHLPIIKLESAEQLQFFVDECGRFYNEEYNDTPSFDEVIPEMDEAYFEKYTVFVIRVEATSGSYRYGVKNIQIESNSVCISVEQTNHPEVVTSDMKEWFAVVSIPKNRVFKCTEFDAILD